MCDLSRRYNSALGLAMLRTFAFQETTRIASSGKNILAAIFFGANDATRPDFFTHVPLEEYGSYLSQMIGIRYSPLSSHFPYRTWICFLLCPVTKQSCKLSAYLNDCNSQAALPGITLLLISPPPVDEDSLNSHPWSYPRQKNHPGVRLPPERNA